MIIDSVLTVVSVCLLKLFTTKYTIRQLFTCCVYSSHCQGQKAKSGSKVKSDDSAQHQFSCSWETRERSRYDRSPVIPAIGSLHSTDNRGGGGETGPRWDHIRASHTLSTSLLNKTRSINPWRSAWARHANKRRLDPCDTWEETLVPHACWSVTL